MEKGPTAAMTDAFSHVVHQVLVIRLLSVPFFIFIAQENFMAKQGQAMLSS